MRDDLKGEGLAPGRRWIFLFALLVLPLLFREGAASEDEKLPWIVLEPESDSRDSDVRAHDEFVSRDQLEEMNEKEEMFHHRLIWKKLPIKNLLRAFVPFCELRFDVVRPLYLTDEEKGILREYVERGGFVLLIQDTYPYSEAEFNAEIFWPIVSFFTVELPAFNTDYDVRKVTRGSRYYYRPPNAHSPANTFITFRGKPCAYITFRGFSVRQNGQWIAEPKPYLRYYNRGHSGYIQTSNLYTYVILH